MRRLFYTLIFFFQATFIYAQNRNVDSIQIKDIIRLNLDSLERLLATKADDTAKANLLSILSYNFATTQAEKSLTYGLEGIQLSKKLGYKRGEANCTSSYTMGLWGVGNYSLSLQNAITALHLYEELKDQERIGFSYYVLANVYRDFGDLHRALIDVRKGYEIYRSMQLPDIIGNAIIGSIYDLQNQMDSASFYVRKAFNLDRKMNNGQWGWLYYLQGNIHRKSGHYDSALYYYW